MSTITVDIILNGSALNVRPHMMVGTLLQFWKSKGISVDIGHVHATSSGCLVGLALVCSRVHKHRAGFWQQIIRGAYTQFSTHGLLDSPTVVSRILDLYFPENAYAQASGNLHLYYYSYCASEGIRKRVQSTFVSNEDLLGAIVKSVAIPFVTRRSLLMDTDRFYFDGGSVPRIEPNPAHVQLVSGVDNILRTLVLHENQFTLPAMEDLPVHLRVLPSVGSVLYTSNIFRVVTLCQRYWFCPFLFLCALLVHRVGIVRAIAQLRHFTLAGMLIHIGTGGLG